MNKKEKIIVALDTPTLYEAKNIISKLKSYFNFYKIGLELITQEGAPKCISELNSLGVEIFFDGKFSDIPNTVAKASETIAKKNVKMFNVHTNCGLESLKAANKVKQNSILLGVTVLTSIQESGCLTLYGKSIETKVTELAGLALEADLDGIVCSPSDLVFLNKNNALKKLLKVTPGIRPEWAQANDQKRTLTPKEAFELGADYLVIGRPLTNPPKEIGSIQNAAEKILKDL